MIDSDFYRQLCERGGFALVAADTSGKIIAWNDAASSIFSVPREQMLGVQLTELAPLDARSAFAKAIARVLRQRRTTEFETRHVTNTGVQRVLMVVLSPILDDAGRPRGVSAWIHDITRRKRLEQQVTEAEKMASLSMLAAGVAHHFNNIIGGVATFVDYALSRGDSAAMRRALQMTAEAASRAAKLTQSLMNFADSERSKRDMADLTEIILTFANLVEHGLNERRISLELALKPVPVLAVPAKTMHQVLGNLLANAEEAMPAGGRICLQLSKVGEELVLRFSDSGCGIPPDALPHIFEPFFTTKGPMVGGPHRERIGLGLSVVRAMVAEMGATIAAESSPGQGTTFIIRFALPERGR